MARSSDRIATPYGTISTTNPQGRANLEATVAPNTLTRGGAFDPVRQAAQSYREAPSTTARQGYETALRGRAAGRPARSASQVFGAPQRVVSPEEQARIDHYKKRFAEMTGENPLMIGTSFLTEGGGMDVTPIREELRADMVSRELAKESQDLLRAETEKVTDRSGVRRYARTPEERVELRAKRRGVEFESGLQNPSNIKAAIDPRAAAKNILMTQRLNDQSSLLGVARRPVQEEVAVAPIQQELADANAAKLADIEQWRNELGRRRPLSY